MLKNIVNETLKLKRTSALWIILACGIILPLLGALITFLEVDSFQTDTPWKTYSLRTWQPAGALLALFLITIVSLIVNIEHSSKTWKLIYTQPSSRLIKNISKYIVVLFSVVGLIMVNILIIILSGYIIGLLNPKLQLINSLPNFKVLVIITYKTFVSTLGIVSLQYWLSMRFKNIFMSLSIGMMLFAVSNILAGWKYNYCLPYISPRLVISETFSKVGMVNDLSKSLVFTLLMFCIISIISQIDLKRRDIV